MSWSRRDMLRASLRFLAGLAAGGVLGCARRPGRVETGRPPASSLDARRDGEALVLTYRLGSDAAAHGVRDPRLASVVVAVPLRGRPLCARIPVEGPLEDVGSAGGAGLRVRIDAAKLFGPGALRGGAFVHTGFLQHRSPVLFWPAAS